MRRLDWWFMFMFVLLVQALKTHNHDEDVKPGRLAGCTFTTQMVVIPGRKYPQSIYECKNGTYAKG